MSLKYASNFRRKYSSNSLFGWAISIFKSRVRRILEDVNGVLQF